MPVPFCQLPHDGRGHSVRHLKPTCIPERAGSTVFALVAAVVPKEQVGPFTMNQRGSKVVPAEAGGLIVTTSLWPKPCAKKHGDLINQLSIVNKVCLQLCDSGASPTPAHVCVCTVHMSIIAS